MSNEFPQWWSDPDGDPRLFNEGEPIPEGWVRRYGRYDVQIGQFVADPDEPPIASEDDGGRNPFDHDGDGKPGGSKPRKRKAK
jgi:hypothetical protein